MLEQKQVVRDLAEAAITKPKLMFKKLEEGPQKEHGSLIGAKTLLYSRKVLIDKIAEILGGKEKRHEEIFN